MDLNIIKVGNVGNVGLFKKGDITMDMIVDMAKVMSKGQITIPKDIRAKLGVDTGDKVMIIWDGERVSMMNPVAYALKMVQKEMEGEAEKAGLTSEEDIIALCKEVRKELGAKRRNESTD